MPHKFSRTFFPALEVQMILQAIRRLITPRTILIRTRKLSRFDDRLPELNNLRVKFFVDSNRVFLHVGRLEGLVGAVTALVSRWLSAMVFLVIYPAFIGAESAVALRALEFTPRISLGFFFSSWIFFHRP